MRREGSRYKPREGTALINWGSSTCPYEALNGAAAVGIAGNKLDYFKAATYGAIHDSGPRLPEWTENKEIAQGWLEKSCIIVRTLLTASEGRGIIKVEKGNTEPLPQAPLYVKYIPKDAEYRVHIFNGEVIDVQRKVKDPGRDVQDWSVRSHRNGFIFTRRGSSGPHTDTIPGDCLVQAKSAMAVSGLEFGAVDVIWSKKRDKAYVLEINTAPGLEGSTVGIYADAIRKYTS